MVAMVVLAVYHVLIRRGQLKIAILFWSQTTVEQMKCRIRGSLKKNTDVPGPIFDGTLFPLSLWCTYVVQPFQTRHGLVAWSSLRGRCVAFSRFISHCEIKLFREPRESGYTSSLRKWRLIDDKRAHIQLPCTSLQ